jgi:hypothetical protein
MLDLCENITAIDIVVSVTPPIKNDGQCADQSHDHALLGTTLAGTLVRVRVPCGLTKGQIDAICESFLNPDFISGGNEENAFGIGLLF